jgi:alpha-glucoside transport system permease protein
LARCTFFFPCCLNASIARSIGWHFLLPAALLVILVLVAPLFQTVVWSFKSDNAKEWVGFKNYVEIFTDEVKPEKVETKKEEGAVFVADGRILDDRFMDILLNNLLWVLVVPAATVVVGTATATLTNQVGPKRERVFKSLIFMPMAISFVAASTIWAYFYSYVPPGRPEVGLLNALVKLFGGEAQPWLTIDQGRLNSFLLMVVIIWLQGGYAMVVISAAIKNVPVRDPGSRPVGWCEFMAGFLQSGPSTGLGNGHVGFCDDPDHGDEDIRHCALHDAW